MKKLLGPSKDGHMELDVNQAREADGEKPLAENIEMREIPIDRLRIPLWHARKSPRRDIDSYAEFIAKMGTYPPISVIESDDQLCDVLDGGRTHEALKKGGHKTAICIVYTNMSAEEAAHKSYIDNSMAKTLTPIDKGHRIRGMRAKGWTYRDLEIKLGYGTAANLSYYDSLLDLPDTIQSGIDSGAITMAHGRALLKLHSPQEQESMAKRIFDEDLSVSKTEEYIDKMVEKDNQVLPEPADNIPTDNPGLIQRCQDDMPEQPSASMDACLCFIDPCSFQTGTKDHFLSTVKPIQKIIAQTRPKLRSGRTIGLVFPDTYNSGKLTGDSETTRHVGHLFHPILTNHGFWFKDRVTINIISDDKVDRHHKALSTATHGSYRINRPPLTLDIYQNKGSQNPPSPVLEKKSRPDEADLKLWTNSLWTFNVKECGGIEEVYKEIAKRFIQLYSNVGDSILDPFVSNQAVFKAALETDRIPTGYIAANQYNPEDWEELFAGEVEPVDFAKANTSALSDDDEAVTDSSAGEPNPQSMTNDIFANASESSVSESM